jgi:hypothetical protein
LLKVVQTHKDVVVRGMKRPADAAAGADAGQEPPAKKVTELKRVEDMFVNVKKYGPTHKQQEQFETDLAVMVSKETSVPLSIVDSPWFRILVLRSDPRLVFPNRQRFTSDILPRVMRDCKAKHTVPFIDKCTGAWLTFDLWMKGGIKVDVFGLNAHVIVDPCDFGAPQGTPWTKRVFNVGIINCKSSKADEMQPKVGAIEGCCTT